MLMASVADDDHDRDHNQVDAKDDDHECGDGGDMAGDNDNGDDDDDDNDADFYRIP